MKTHADMEKVLFSKEEISEKVAEVAKRLSADYEGKNPLLICVLKGASVFFVDLIREISIDIEMEFMSVSSYGNSTQSSGRVKIEKDLVEYARLKKDIVTIGVYDKVEIWSAEEWNSRRKAKSAKIG